MTQTPHQRAEAELTTYGLTFPETTSGPGWTITRALYVRKKMFAVFGEKGKHVRAAVGAPSLPLGVPVEIEFVFEVE